MYSSVPFGKNLESACKAFAFRETMKFVDFTCAYCGCDAGFQCRARDAAKAFCSPACQQASRLEAEAEAS